jgi:hypothetical protein
MPFLAPTYAFLMPHMPYGSSYVFLAPHMPYGAPYAFLAPHLPSGAPSAFLAPLCLFGAHLCLLAPHLPFASPICLLAPPFFFEKTYDKMSGSRKGPWFSIPMVQFVDDIIIMRNNQSALPTASAIFSASFPRVRMCLDPSHHFVWAHKREFSLRSSM